MVAARAVEDRRGLGVCEEDLELARAAHPVAELGVDLLLVVVAAEEVEVGVAPQDLFQELLQGARRGSLGVGEADPERVGCLREIVGAAGGFFHAVHDLAK